VLCWGRPAPRGLSRFSGLHPWSAALEAKTLKLGEALGSRPSLMQKYIQEDS